MSAEKARASELLALAVIVVAAAALRFAGLDAQSLWYDESVTATIVEGSLRDVLERLPDSESTPPLYYVLLWTWTAAFGDGEAALRSLSALCGTALVPVTYAAARRLGPRAGGLIAATIVAINPMLFWYSQEARAYSLLTLLAGLSALAMLAVLERPSRRRLALWAASGVLLMLTHYFAAFLVAAEAAILLWRLAGERARVAVACLPWLMTGAALLPLAASQESDGRTAWITSEPLSERAGDVLRELATANTALISSNSPAPGGAYWIPAVLGLLLAAALVAARRGRVGSGVSVVAIAGAAALLVPLVLAVTPLDFFKDRNLVAAWPLLAVALGAGLARVASARWAAAAAGGIAAGGLLVCLAVARDESLQRPDWRAALASLQPGDVSRAIVVRPPYARAPLHVYGVDAVPLAEGTGVDELVLVGTEVQPQDAPAVLGGLRVVERRRRGHVGLVRYRATAGLERMDERALRVVPELLYQPSVPATRWAAGIGAVVTVWQRAVETETLDGDLRADVLVANRRARQLTNAPAELPHPDRLERRLRSALVAANRYTLRPTAARRDSLRQALARIAA